MHPNLQQASKPSAQIESSLAVPPGLTPEQAIDELALEREAVALLLAAIGVAGALGFVVGHLFTRWGFV